MGATRRGEGGPVEVVRTSTAHDEAVAVLDVGAGYGEFAPNNRITRPTALHHVPGLDPALHVWAGERVRGLVWVVGYGVLGGTCTTRISLALEKPPSLFRVPVVSTNARYTTDGGR